MARATKYRYGLVGALVATGLLICLYNLSGRGSATTLIESTVCQQNLKPVIQSPANNSLHTKATITVRGKSVANATITIFEDNQAVAITKVKADGTFAAPTPLRLGQNRLSAEARLCDQVSRSDPVDVSRVDQHVYFLVAIPLLLILLVIIAVRHYRYSVGKKRRTKRSKGRP